MTRGKQTTAFALAGAVALASGAYALGSQAGDGSAAADNSGTPTHFGPGGRPGFGRGGPPGFGLDRLADRLGVSESALQNAIEDIRGDAKGTFAKELAAALKIDAAKVTAALEKVRPERPPHPRFRRPTALAAELAKELGLSTAKVRAALRQNRDPDALAKALGVSEHKLHDAFHAVIGKDRPHPPGRPGFGNLAKELGVTQAQLRAALEKVRANHKDLRDDFAQALADRLKIDVAKVQDVLDDLKPPRLRGRHP
jgi:AraC-like DNA-binding protein